MLQLFKNALSRQYAAVIIGNLSAISLGLSLVWASPMLIKLRDENQAILSRPVRESEESWIVSMNQLIGLLTLLISGHLMDYFGRKTMVMFVFLPRLAMCFVAIFATEVWMVLLSRALGGVADLLTMSVVPTYSSEVAGKKIRGASGTVMQIMVACGMLIMFGVGPFVSYFTVNIVMTCIVVVTFIPIYFVPESPYFLFAKGRIEESLEVLTLLRGTEDLANEEIETYAYNSDNEDVDKWSLLKDTAVIKAFGITIVLSIGLIMSGFNAVNFYLQTIFESTQTSISSEISSLISGLIQLIACCCTFFLTDRFGRKPILCTTLVAMTIGMVGLGTFFNLFDPNTDNIRFLNYLPLISITLIIFGNSAGMGSLVWMQIAELFEETLRPYGVSCGIFIASIFSFLISLYFPTVISSVGDAQTYWIFGGCCLFLCLFIFFIVPETKRKSFSEIQQELGRKYLKIADKA